MLNLDCSSKRPSVAPTGKLPLPPSPLFTHIKPVVVLFCRAAMLLLKHVEAHCTEMMVGGWAVGGDKKCTLGRQVDKRAGVISCFLFGGFY